MKRLHLALAAVLLLVAAAAGQTQEAVQNVAKQTANALAVVRFTLVNEGGSRTVAGQAICIDPTGVFASLALDSRLPRDVIKEVELIPPGLAGKLVKAELLGLDPVTGISFVKSTGKHEWKAVLFADTSELSIGQEVISVGLFMGDVGNLPYYGIAHVSTIMQVPEWQVYVTGGKLTAIGSPVFTAGGRAVGIVGRQLPLNYGAVINRRMVPLVLQGRQETSFFLPVEEFAFALKATNIPAKGSERRLPWLGVVRFPGVSDATAKDRGLGDRPGVLVEQIVPGGPAAKADLKERDIIVAMNGRKLPRLGTPDLTARKFVRTLSRLPIGQKITLTVVREGKDVPVPVTLEAIPKQAHEAPRYFCAKLGFIVREKVMLDKYLLRNVPIDVDGLIVVFVAPRGQAAQGMLRVGDLVTSVNEQPVKAVAGIKRIAEAALVAEPNRAINLLVRRGGQPRAVSIMPPRK